MMRRIVPFIVVGLIGMVLAPPAIAAGPTHERLVFEGNVTIPAGDLCDFDYYESWYAEANRITWGDPADPTKQMINGPIVVYHTNLATDYTLVEKASYMDMYNAGDATWRQIGLFWHLRDPDGKMVVVQAGQVIWDVKDWSVISFTPNSNPDFAAVMCPALGGFPA